MAGPMYRCFGLGQIVHKTIASYPSFANKQIALPEDIGNRPFTNQETVHRETIGMSKANDCFICCPTFLPNFAPRRTEELRMLTAW